MDMFLSSLLRGARDEPFQHDYRCYSVGMMSSKTKEAIDSLEHGGKSTRGLVGELRWCRGCSCVGAPSSYEH